MIKQVLFTLLLTLSPLCAISQNSAEMRVISDRADQVKAMKIGYMADQIKLTTEQSVMFWPIYNEYWTVRYELFQRKRKVQDRIKLNSSSSTDIEELINIEAEQATIMRSFVIRFTKVISIDQTAKMFVAEENFKSVLLKTLK